MPIEITTATCHHRESRRQPLNREATVLPLSYRRTSLCPPLKVHFLITCTLFQIDTSLPKDKQTSQAKNIVQQKRKALADLFKYLAKMGLNYRTGLVILSTNQNLYDFTIPPVDLDAAMSYLKNRYL